MSYSIISSLEAYAVFLNIPLGLYTVDVDWYYSFQDETELYNRIVSAVDRGILEKEDELKWLYPNMTDEEIADKLAIISATQATNTDQALERILAGK